MTTVGVARTAPAFTRGIDCLTPMANNVARMFKADGYIFVGRYLETLTLLERDWIFSAGLGIFLYTEATSGFLDAAAGSGRGIASVARAKALQAPPTLHTLIDLESTTGDAASVSDYANVFHDELVSGGYDSITYVGAGQILDAAQLYALKTHRYMRSGSLVPKPKCGWCALQLSPLDQIIHGQRVDVVIVENDYDGRRPTLWFPS
jgi:hypothetical protein